MTMDDYVLCSVLAFDDDTLSVQLLHRGGLEACKGVARMIDALSYNGPKRVVESCVQWMPYEAYQAALEDRIDEANAIKKSAEMGLQHKP
jgi:hypothetical protein